MRPHSTRFVVPSALLAFATLCACSDDSGLQDAGTDDAATRGADVTDTSTDGAPTQDAGPDAVDASDASEGAPDVEAGADIRDAGADIDATDTPAEDGSGPLFNARYCEVLVARASPPAGFSIEAYNTVGCNACPDEDWAALDADALGQELASVYVRLNGPRHWLLDSISSSTTSSTCDAVFGGIEMSLVAEIPVSLGDLSADLTYTVNSVSRDTVWHYNAGRQLFVLEDPSGRCFAMQSYSQKVDASLGLDDLEALGQRLDLPAGWSYRAITLDTDFALEAPDGEAQLVADELENAYQLLHEGCL